MRRLSSHGEARRCGRGRFGVKFVAFRRWFRAMARSMLCTAVMKNLRCLSVSTALSAFLFVASSGCQNEEPTFSCDDARPYCCDGENRQTVISSCGEDGLYFCAEGELSASACSAEPIRCSRMNEDYVPAHCCDGEIDQGPPTCSGDDTYQCSEGTLSARSCNSDPCPGIESLRCCGTGLGAQANFPYCASGEARCSLGGTPRSTCPEDSAECFGPGDVPGGFFCCGGGSPTCTSFGVGMPGFIVCSDGGPRQTEPCIDETDGIWICRDNLAIVRTEGCCPRVTCTGDSASAVILFEEDECSCEVEEEVERLVTCPPFGERSTLNGVPVERPRFLSRCPPLIEDTPEACERETNLAVDEVCLLEREGDVNEVRVSTTCPDCWTPACGVIEGELMVRVTTSTCSDCRDECTDEEPGELRCLVVSDEALRYDGELLPDCL